MTKTKTFGEHPQSKSDSRDLWPLRHLIRVISRLWHDQQKDNDKDKDNDNEWWGDMTWPKLTMTTTMTFRELVAGIPPECHPIFFYSINCIWRTPMHVMMATTMPTMRIMRLLRLSGDPPVPPLTSFNHPWRRSHSYSVHNWLRFEHLALLLWWVLGSILQCSGWSRESREQIDCRRCCHCPPTAKHCSPTARQTPRYWHPDTSFHI